MVAQQFDLIVMGGIAATINGIAPADIGVLGGKIVAIGDIRGSGARVVDAKGLHILPGVIDTQVHFREPGMEYKEDLASGTAAAVLGGVTGVFEMPNTRPSTTTAELLADKFRRARGRVRCDIAFYVGASPENVAELAELERMPGCAGIKIFMGSSTGNLLIPDDRTLEQVLRNGRRRVAVHAEDEDRLRERAESIRKGGDVASHPDWRDVDTALHATRRLLDIARRAARRVHVLHVSTVEEIDLLARHKDIASVETTPQHLTLVAPECYEKLGTFAQMNPPIRDERHRAGLWRGVTQGIVDVIGSDHAPHSREEKAKPYPESPSGMPGVQTLLPLLLDHCHAGRLSLERVIDLTSAGPARLFGIVGKGRIAVGYDADLTVVDLRARRKIDNSWIASKCGWTPFDGVSVTGWPKMTIVRGNVVMRDDEIVGDAIGEPIKFTEGSW